VTIRILAFMYLTTVSGFAQGSPQTLQNAQNATCSNTNIAAPNAKTVTFTCSGLAPEQAKALHDVPGLLNKLLRSQQGESAQIIQKLDALLANQGNVSILIEKLNQLLANTNPNQPIKTYFCNGEWRSAGPGARAALEVVRGGDDSIFKSMVQLYNSAQYEKLINACQSQIHSNPDWLTPYLLCGLAYLSTGNTEKAKEMTVYFDKNTGPAYQEGACQQMSDLLHTHLPTTR